MSLRLRAALPHAVMLGVSGLLYHLASGIDASGAGGGRLGPDVWPRFIVLVMGALCAIEVVRRLWIGPRAAAAHAPASPAGVGTPTGSAEPSEGNASSAPPSVARLLAGIALIAGYVAFVPTLGFFVATAVFLAVFTLLGGVRRPLLAVTIGAVGALVLVIVFMRVAYVSLPLGTGPFKDVSVLLLRVLGV